MSAESSEQIIVDAGDERMDECFACKQMFCLLYILRIGFIVVKENEKYFESVDLIDISSKHGFRTRRVPNGIKSGMKCLQRSVNIYVHILTHISYR